MLGTARPSTATRAEAVEALRSRKRVGEKHGSDSGVRRRF